MILDEITEFCDATSLNTGAAGTYNVGDVIDSSVARDLGNGQRYIWSLPLPQELLLLQAQEHYCFRLSQMGHPQSPQMVHRLFMLKPQHLLPQQ